jgi:hypothetical protein
MRERGYCEAVVARYEEAARDDALLHQLWIALTPRDSPSPLANGTVRLMLVEVAPTDPGAVSWPIDAATLRTYGSYLGRRFGVPFQLAHRRVELDFASSLGGADFFSYENLFVPPERPAGRYPPYLHPAVAHLMEGLGVERPCLVVFTAERLGGAEVPRLAQDGACSVIVNVPLVPAADAFDLYTHEVGHALGLGHAFVGEVVIGGEGVMNYELAAERLEGKMLSPLERYALEPAGGYPDAAEHARAYNARAGCR